RISFLVAEQSPERGPDRQFSAELPISATALQPQRERLAGRSRARCRLARRRLSLLPQRKSQISTLIYLMDVIGQVHALSGLPSPIRQSLQRFRPTLLSL